MGAWGADSFENDDASDWLADFCQAPDTESTTTALSTIAEMADADYLEAPDCCVGIAPAEVVVAQKGAPNAGFSAEAKTCLARLESKAVPGLVSLALKAFERIRTNSELK